MSDTPDTPDVPATPDPLDPAKSSLSNLLSPLHFLFTVSHQPSDTFKIIRWHGHEAL